MSQSPVRVRPSDTIELQPQASTTVISALAAAENVNPIDLDVTLYDVIDPDALDALFASDLEEGIVVEFTIGGYTVTVKGADHVLVEPAD